MLEVPLWSPWIKLWIEYDCRQSKHLYQGHKGCWARAHWLMKSYHIELEVRERSRQVQAACQARLLGFETPGGHQHLPCPEFSSPPHVTIILASFNLAKSCSSGWPLLSLGLFKKTLQPQTHPSYELMSLALEGLQVSRPWESGTSLRSTGGSHSPGAHY